jgi:uncharacterized protein (TIGR00369 family)
MNGLEYLRSLSAHASAPIAETLGFSLTEVDAGRVVFELEPKKAHENPMGTIHGGVIATLCDSAAGAAVHSTLEPGQAYTTLEVKVSFVKAVTAKTGRVRCEGTVVARGSRVATSQATLRDASGKLLAHATATCLIMGRDG